jgi:phosphoserine phosphatase
VLIARVIAEPAQLSASFDRAGLLPFRSEPLATDPGVFELEFAHDDRAALRAVVEQACPGADLLITDHPPELPQLFVSDMDSTMIGQECIDELADFAGLKPQIAEITERAMQGELDFVQALTERVRLLAGLDEAAIAQCLSERITAMPGARVLVETLKARGCHTVLVTGGFHQFADPVAAMLGFDEVVGNRLAIAAGKLTGELDGPIVDSAVKARVLRDGAAARGGVSLATGDGANDIPMLVAADYGFAYRAKPKARAAANGAVDSGDLTSVLRLLGIPASDWALG